MKGAAKGLLENSEDLCAKPQRASADFTAQNGKVYDTKPILSAKCGGRPRRTAKPISATTDTADAGR